ncbi:hypothetical protein GMMP15_660097 [Candidatus Magnetomoraceae bacterium gMMP-15]
MEINENTQLYNSKIFDTYIKLIENKYTYIDKNDLLSYAGMEPHKVKDEDYWFTQKQVNNFHDRLRELTGNKSIAREAGRYAASPNTFGKIQKYILGLGTPVLAYNLISKFAKKFTKSSTYKTKKLDSNKVQITVTIKDGVNEQPFQCENRIGYFEAIARLFNLQEINIEHPSDFHTATDENGRQFCKYIISWKKISYEFWKFTRNIIFIILAVLCFISGFMVSWDIFIIILISSFLIVAFLNWRVGTLEKKQLNEALNHLREYSDELSDQVEINAENARAIQEIRESHSKMTDFSEILTKAAKILKDRLYFDQSMILLTDRNKKHLIFRAGSNFSDNELKYLKHKKFRLDEQSREVFAVSFNEQRDIVLNNINNELENNNLEFELLTKLEAESLICYPAIYGGEALGLIVLSNTEQRPLIQKHADRVMEIAPEIGAIIHNFLMKIDNTIEHIRKKAMFSLKKESKKKDLHLKKEKEKSKISILETQANLSMRAVHNIRTPIHAFNMYFDVLKRDYSFDPEVSNIYKKMKRQITRIEELVNDFLKFSKPLKIRLVKMELNDLIQPIVKDYSEFEKKIKFEFCPDEKLPEIEADTREIKWVIEEMLNNASKSGAKSISIKTKYSENQAHIYFEDDGKGVKKEMEEKLFEPFESGDSMNTGLGLANIKKIIEEHQGKIDYDSSYSPGARFVIQLPLKFFDN